MTTSSCVTSSVPLWRTTISPAVLRAAQADLAGIAADGRMVDGPRTRRLEDALTDAFDRSAVAVSSAMDGLELVLDSVNIRDREVLIPANCFPSVPALVMQGGGIPVPVPVNDVDLAIDQRICEHPALSRLPLVIWVHHAGIVAGHAEVTIGALRRSGCLVVEDGAYLLPGARPAGGPGTWGDAAVLSFGPTKPLSGVRGGAVLLGDQGLAADIAGRRAHSGQESRWESGDAIYRNRCIGEGDASIAFHQFEHRRTSREHLAELADLYVRTLTDVQPSTLVPGRDPQPTWARFPIDTGTNTATATRAQLVACGIGSSIMFERPWFDYPAFAAVVTNPPGWPEQRSLLNRTLCVPFHPTLTREDCLRVAAALAVIAPHQAPRSEES